MATDRSGATAAEYALVLAIVGSTLALGAIFLGSTISAALNSSANSIAACFGNTTC